MEIGHWRYASGLVHPRVLTAKEHRGRLRLVMTANTGIKVFMDLELEAAWEFAEGLEAALRPHSP